MDLHDSLLLAFFILVINLFFTFLACQICDLLKSRSFEKFNKSRKKEK